MLFVITMLFCFISSLFIRNTRLIGFLAMMVLAYLAGDADPLTTIDYSVYLMHYNLLGFETSPFEKGYTVLSQFFFYHGLNYAQFRLFFAFLAFVIMFIGVSLFTKKVALFAGLYGLTVFFNDATQIRNLMMIAITILGAGLLAKKNRIPKIFGVFALLIASQFHDLGFVFLLVIVPLSLIKLDTLIRYYKYFVFFLYGVAAFFMVNSDGIVINFFASFLSKFSSRDNSADNVLTSFGRGSSHSTIIFVWILLLLFSPDLKLKCNT
ncbi:EpsG family protein [Secundilactobacillus collinoides]|uniref:EpsG family protein n=1 Tax=Secundilactobacillus collinoides TaxID=33960 RepID=UPI000704A309|nr:EpsG family protein [Secundilactobacillus collinoides]